MSINKVTPVHSPYGSPILDQLAEANLELPMKPAENPLYQSSVVFRSEKKEREPKEILAYHPPQRVDLIYLREKANDIITYPFRQPFVEESIGLALAAATDEEYPVSVRSIFPGLFRRYQVTSTYPVDFYHTDPPIFFWGDSRLVNLKPPEKAIAAYARTMDYVQEVGKEGNAEFLKSAAGKTLLSSGFPAPRAPEQNRLITQSISFGVGTFVSLGVTTRHWLGVAAKMPHPTEGKIINAMPVRYWNNGKWESIWPEYNRPLVDDGSIDLRIRFGALLGPGIGIGLNFSHLGWPEDLLNPLTQNASTLKPFRRIEPYIDARWGFQ